MNKDIIVRGARENNLKNISVKIPRDKFTVITGLSGSGKSTLAFNTIYAEGQRRYVESLSAYARQFLGNMTKPDVDSIDGLSPAIAIEQKTTSKNPRSTVGTVTEIYDYLRLLYAKVGKSYCPKCNEEISPQSAENISNLILFDIGKKIVILAPIISGQKGTHERVFENLQKEGFSKVRVNGVIYDIDEAVSGLNLVRYQRHWIEVVIDRVKVLDDDRHRISDSVEQALIIGKGVLIVLDFDKNKKILDSISGKIDEKILKKIQREAQTTYSNFGTCKKHPQILFLELEARNFSFNSPFGACNTCLGLGFIKEFDINLVIPDKSKSILDGAIGVYGNMDLNWRSREMANTGKAFGYDLLTPIKDFTKKQLDVLLYGFPKDLKEIEGYTKARFNKVKKSTEGIIPQSKRLYSNTDSDNRRLFFDKFMSTKKCSACDGKRLKENILSVKISDKSIIDVTYLSIQKSLNFFDILEEKLSKKDKVIAKQVLKEINSRLNFLNSVGLSYIDLSRSAGTLSGGEAQRIRLATQIGSNLMGVLYVLDEPSIGLHQRDNEKLIKTLCKLRDIGNTLIVVEHDEDTILAADYLIDIGPGAGINGGEIVASGSPLEVMKNKKSLTGKYLSGEKSIENLRVGREIKDFIEISGCSDNNLKNVSAKFPTKVLTGITGVSGSGKSTLVTKTLIPALKKSFKMDFSNAGSYKKIKVPDSINNIIVMDQSPIGRTPRSNPATYIKVFDDIRKIFASTKESKLRGYSLGRFSFNVKGGRCETCRGDGTIKIEMNFLPDVYVECEDCFGKRYNKDTLEITYKGLNISEVLDLDVTKAVDFFENHTLIHRKIKTLLDVGLGYIKLGQSSTTLSGGESQRIKLTKELAKFKKGNTLYVLDEPTTGLHFEDVNKLISVLNSLVDKGNTIIVIEHNLDLIKCCDYIIDLGLEGGDGGGEILVSGSPQDIVNCKKSYTGKFLKKLI